MCAPHIHDLPPQSIQNTFCKHTCSGLIDTLVQAQWMILWGFLDTLTRFLPTGRVWMDSIVYTLFLKIEILNMCLFVLPPRSICSKNQVFWAWQKHRKCAILGVNGVAVARYGLILWENDATGSRKVSRYLPGLREAMTNSENAAKVQKTNKNKSHHCLFFMFFVCIL